MKKNLGVDPMNRIWGKGHRLVCMCARSDQWYFVGSVEASGTCVFWKTWNNHMAQRERERECARERESVRAYWEVFRAEPHTHAHACAHTDLFPEKRITQRPLMSLQTATTLHCSSTCTHIVPFFGSSSLAILVGGDTNSSSLKGLFMPELLWTHTHAHKSVLKCP